MEEGRLNNREVLWFEGTKDKMLWLLLLCPLQTLADLAPGVIAEWRLLSV